MFIQKQIYNKHKIMSHAVTLHCSVKSSCDTYIDLIRIKYENVYVCINLVSCVSCMHLVDLMCLYIYILL